MLHGKLEMVVVGGMNKHVKDIIPNRPHLDIDVICSYEDWGKWLKSAINRGDIAVARPLAGNKMMARMRDGFVVEAEVWYEEGEHAHKMFLAGKSASVCYEQPNKFFDVDDVYEYHPVVSFLYMMKMSHRFLRNSVHFQKTHKDIMAMRKKLGTSKVEMCYAGLLEEREALTYTYDHPKLNVSKGEFFTENVPYVYDHDSIHEAVKLSSKPAYTYFIDGEVMCSMKKFEECSKAIKLMAVVEESMVLALERSIIPFGTDATKAYTMALEKVCTSITSGKFRLFAWEHFDEAMALFEPEWMMQKWEDGLKNGVVTPFKKEMM